MPRRPFLAVQQTTVWSWKIDLPFARHNSRPGSICQLHTAARSGRSGCAPLSLGLGCILQLGVTRAVARLIRVLVLQRPHPSNSAVSCSAAPARCSSEQVACDTGASSVVLTGTSPDLVRPGVLVHNPALCEDRGDSIRDMQELRGVVLLPALRKP